MGAGVEDTPWFEVHRTPGATVLRLGGDIDLAVRDRLRDAIADATDGGQATVRIDLRAVTFLDSSGLHELLTARELAADVVLIAPSAAVRRVFDVSAVGPLFTIVDDG